MSVQTALADPSSYGLSAHFSDQTGDDYIPVYDSCSNAMLLTGTRYCVSGIGSPQPIAILSDDKACCYGICPSRSLATYAGSRTSICTTHTDNITIDIATKLVSDLRSADADMTTFDPFQAQRQWAHAANQISRTPGTGRRRNKDFWGPSNPVNDARAFPKMHTHTRRSQVLQSLVHACVSLKGRCHRNEDRTFAQVPTYTNPSDVAIFGVFDGHGGVAAADYCGKNMMRFLRPETLLRANASRYLTRAFVECDSAYLQTCVDDKTRQRAGTTALVMACTGKRLIVANAGDCRAVLSRGGKAVPLSTDHKPTLASERARIEQRGRPLTTGDSTVASSPWHMRARKDLRPVIGGWRGRYIVNPKLGIGVSVSRGIGDYYFKHKQMIRSVVPHPEVVDLPMSDDDEFVVLASDGLWDVMGSDEVVDFLHHQLDFQQNLSITQEKIEEAINVLANNAIVRGSTDSITVVLVLFGVNCESQTHWTKSVRRLLSSAPAMFWRNSSSAVHPSRRPPATQPNTPDR